MRIAALDLGTNTFHLLIAEKAENDSVRFLSRKTCVVKLGKDGFSNGLINTASFQRGIKAMKTFLPLLKKFKPDKTIALATSAIRSCKNGNIFISKSEKIIGNRIQIITGAREAELIYQGVKNSFPFSNEPVLIMDIGGGSVEFIIANQSKILWKKSIEAGAARLLEQFSPSNPLKDSELSAMNSYLENMFSPVLKSVNKFKPQILIGSSGSFDSFSLMTGNRSAKPLVEISLNKYIALHKHLMSSTKKERNTTKGLHRMRVDMIVPASVCAYFILQRTGMRKMYRSAYALKEGIIFSEV